MSFQPEQDIVSKRTSMTIDRFHGCHYGYSKLDQPKEFAQICDFDIRNEKLQIRAGKRKVNTDGYTATISSMFSINIGNGNWVGRIVNGAMQAIPSDVVLGGDRVYWTWREIAAAYTWRELAAAETWQSLKTGRND